MSDAANVPPKNPVQKPLPAWVASGVLGLVLGGGACFLVTYWHYAPDPEIVFTGPPPGVVVGGRASGWPPPGMAGGPMMGGMGGGMMGGGGGGAGAPRSKRNLTSIVGKLDLVSKGITLRLDDEQSAKLAAELANLDQPEKMTQEEAQERLDAIEGLLTDEQKETLALFEIPRGAGGGQGGDSGGPPVTPGMGGPPPGMGGGGGGSDDDNPFQQDTNQSRLHSLLDRLKGSVPGEVPAKATNEAGE